jgi:hypothetical protein
MAVPDAPQLVRVYAAEVLAALELTVAVPATRVARPFVMPPHPVAVVQTGEPATVAVLKVPVAAFRKPLPAS